MNARGDDPRRGGSDEQALLRELVELDIEWGVAKKRRDLFVAASAVGGLLPWIKLRAPSWIPTRLQDLGVVVWSILLCVTFCSVLIAWQTRRELERHSRLVAERQRR